MYFLNTSHSFEAGLQRHTCLFVCVQVVFGHGKGVSLQSFLLAGVVSHLYHRHHQDQYILFGLSGGLFLLHVVWRNITAAAGEICPQIMGLSDSVHLYGHQSEESPLGKKTFTSVYEYINHV